MLNNLNTFIHVRSVISSSRGCEQAISLQITAACMSLMEKARKNVIDDKNLSTKLKAKIQIIV